MTKVISEGPVFAYVYVCKNCGYGLEYNIINLVPAEAGETRLLKDFEGNDISYKGQYLICPRQVCKFRNLIERDKKREMVRATNKDLPG